jgi:hypothetical protein
VRGQCNVKAAERSNVVASSPSALVLGRAFLLIVARQTLLGTLTAVVFFLFFHAIFIFMDPDRLVLEALFCVLLSLIGFGMGFSAAKKR